MWSSAEHPPTSSQTTNWLEEEDALLNEITFNHPATNDQEIQSEKMEEPHVASSLQHGRPQVKRSYSQNALTKPASALEGQRSTLEVPEAYRPIFRFSHFNRMQSEAMDKVLRKNALNIAKDHERLKSEFMDH
ncbi:hypothetical protein [Absidia glauca]|uniref:Uncharacterized protein n=1 Tax=Absidia glauca TaxID=4829 RepID=A0A163J207_ABSGL|nr:hypothetical protein [Absidia glauca]